MTKKLPGTVYQLYRGASAVHVGLPWVGAHSAAAERFELGGQGIDELLSAVRPPRERRVPGAWTLADALHLRRRRDDQPHESVRSGALMLRETADPELLLLKARYKTEFEGAIRGALESIPAKQRTLLLLQIVDGLTLPQLAAMHRVSRATGARWLAEARRGVFEATRRQLREGLGLSTSEYESVAALIRSQLDLSLATLLPAVSAPSPSSRRRPG